MATYNKAAMQYQRNAIQTASPAKLTLMLYDGAIKFANMAIDFEVVYDYIYRRLVEANVKKDKAVLEDALHHIKTMRETWKEVMRINNVV